MSDSFDIGPLTWVQDDINQSLDAVLESVEKLGANPSETADMRFAQTHLYQASGALDMVGLEGCKLFCSYLEKLADKLEKQEVDVTTELLEHFTKALKTLKYYIQELLNGSADIPLRLYPVLQPITQALDEAVEESAFFFPDTSHTVPKDLASQEFSEEEYASFIAKQRTQFQKSLLTWMQGKDENAVNNMVEALSEVMSAQHKPNVKTLWWGASAFGETLAQPDAVESISAKKLCRKLDQELKLLSAGENKANPELLRSLLYFVAISDVDNERVNQVKKTFSLNDLVETSAASTGAGLSDEKELGTVGELKTAIAALREIWEEVSNKINFDNLDANEDAALVDLDNVLITKFADQLSARLDDANSLSQAAVSDLFVALSEAAVVLRDDKTKTTQYALIEVAAALHLLDDALVHYQNLDGDIVQHMQSEVERLNAVAKGETLDTVETKASGSLDRDTVEAVTKDIDESLKVIEQALDTYFRNTEDKTTLTLTPTPVKQMAAIFDMLSLETPAEIVKACGHYIQYFQQDDYQENQDDFELVAESLSMIGLYTNEMPNVRPESDKALEGALERLNEALAATGISFEEDEEPAEDPVTVITQKVEKKAEGRKVPEGDVGEKILDKAFDDELADIYLTEAEEVLAQIAQHLQALRVDAEQHEPVVEVRRSYHTLKGSGRTVGLTGQAEVAAKVETFLNGVLDKQEHLKPFQLTKLEEITAAFASWAAALRANGEVRVDQAFWLDQAGILYRSEPAAESKPVSEATDEQAPVATAVLIDGKRELSRQFYEIFLNESMQNLSILEQDVAKLTDNTVHAPETKARHAVHTLASNALAAGFTPMGELGRALENWLDEVADIWVSDEHLPLYTKATKAIAKMWQSVSELKTPRAARAIIKSLDAASEKASQHKEQEVIDTVLYDGEQAEAEEAVSTEVAEDLNEILEEITLDVTDIDGEAPPVEDNVQAVQPEEVEAEEEQPEEVVVEAADDSTLIADTSKGETNPELLALFTEEANEILPQIGSDLRAWKSKPKTKEHSDSLQRSLHTLKGSARMAAQTEIGNIAHGLEEYILKVSKKVPTDDDFENMFVELDKIASVFEGKPVEVDNAASAVSVEMEVSTPEEDAEHIARATDRKAQFLRMKAEVLDRLINEAGEVSIIRSRIDREMLGFKKSSHDLTDSLVRLRNYLRELEIEAETQMQSRMNILQESDESFDPLEFDRFTRLQELTRMIAESVNDVGTIQTNLLDNLDQTESALQAQNRMSRDLQQGLIGIRMLPFQQISERMQRIVRQTSRELKKSVDLVIEGESTGVDRSVLDRISAPLEHLLRNSVAHGIESKTARKASGKPQNGTIHIKVQTVNDEIHITVNDDGAGVDLEKVKTKAINNNLLDANADINEDALLSVIFEPGFSTAEDVSQIAGRGVGLDVVRNDISSLGGRIDMSSEAGKGATFNIFLPVTQSVAQVLVVRTGEDVFALPVAMIEQAQKVKRNDLLGAYADGKVEWNGVNYAFHHLAKLLDHQDHEVEDLPYASVLLLRSGAHTIALHIDEVIGNQEVVMKEIGPQLSRVPGIVGATVTGNGEVVLIINPVQIANREVLSVGSVGVKNVKSKAKKAANKSRALVVDDSLTMRKVLGRLLEREGFEVQVANDGMDAMELLQISTPDIILTDIEMPRMDGFGLARNIRDDERTKHTPLIMISSRTADKHQNLATEIGVDAFFGKPVQDEELVAKMKELLNQ